MSGSNELWVKFHSYVHFQITTHCLFKFEILVSLYLKSVVSFFTKIVTGNKQNVVWYLADAQSYFRAARASSARLNENKNPLTNLMFTNLQKAQIANKYLENRKLPYEAIKRPQKRLLSHILSFLKKLREKHFRRWKLGCSSEEAIWKNPLWQTASEFNFSSHTILK